MIFLFDPGVSSTNLGDLIISEGVRREIAHLFPHDRLVVASTHTYLSAEVRKVAVRSRQVLVGGSNLLSPEMLRYRSWKLGPMDVLALRNQVLLGTGWGKYMDKPDALSRRVLRAVLSDTAVHAVRSDYTRLQLANLGIHNVVNTGCPTLWTLTPSFCAEIPATKAAAAVFTLTDYDSEPDLDRVLVETVCAAYDEVYFWPQGVRDREYLESLDLDLSRVGRVDPSLQAYDDLLAAGGCDYVGTRLHGGIRALQHGLRTIIVSIDNRAVEMARDFCLQVVHRQDLRQRLAREIENPQPCQVRIDAEAIETFRNQFRRTDASA